MIGSIVLLALVTLERLGEPPIAARNTRALLAQGAVEHSPRHYPFIIALHACWMAGLWLLAWNRPMILPWLAVFLGLQVLRVWILLSLGKRWTTRIITVPGETLVRRGPYRFLKHPNYWIVVGEIATLPLVFGMWRYALVFSLLNAAMLTIRIRAEDRALATLHHV